MEMLFRKFDRVGFFRPIIHVAPSMGERRDADINLIASHYKLGFSYEQMYGYSSMEANNLVSLGKEEVLIEGIIQKYELLSEKCDFILCEGTDFASSAVAFEFDINAEISKNLGAPVLLVARAYQKSSDDIARSIELAIKSLEEKGVAAVGDFIAGLR